MVLKRHMARLPIAIRRYAIAVVCLIAADGFSVAEAAPYFRIAKIPGMYRAVGINNSGVVVGDGIVNGRTMPVIWRNGALAPIGVELAGRTINSARAIAINDRGQVLGEAEIPPDYAGRRYVPFLWDAGGARELPCPQDQCSAIGLGDDGSAGGVGWLTGRVDPRGTVWRDFIPQYVELLPGGVPSVMASVGPNGLVFGQRTDGSAFHWRDGITTAMPLPGANDPFWLGNFYTPQTVDLVAANRLDHFVGLIDARSFGFHWRDGRYTRIGTFPLADFPAATAVRTWPSAVNDSDWVVGTVVVEYETPAPFGVDGFLWTPTEGASRISQRIHPQDPLKGRIDWMQLTAINNQARIAGTGSFGGTGDEAILLTPSFQSNNDLLIDFGPQYGLWLRQNDNAWVGVRSVSAQHMASGDLDNDGRSDLLIDFGAPYGIWAWRNGESWTSIHGTSAQQIVATDLDNNGQTDFVINFGPPHGLWVRMNDATWTLLHGTAPRQVVSANLDADPRRDLVVDFGPPYGIWLWMNNTNWVPLHSTSARDMVAGDLDGNGIDEIVIDFGSPYGIWTRLNQQSWVPLHGTSSAHMAIGNFDSDPRKDVVVDFGSAYGIWQWKNNSAWSPIHGTSAQALAVADMDRSGIDDLVVSFGDPYGLWAWKNGTSWQVLHGVSPPRLIATDVDGQ